MNLKISLNWCCINFETRLLQFDLMILTKSKYINIKKYQRVSLLICCDRKLSMYFQRVMKAFETFLFVKKFTIRFFKKFVSTRKALAFVSCTCKCCEKIESSVSFFRFKNRAHDFHEIETLRLTRRRFLSFREFSFDSLSMLSTLSLSEIATKISKCRAIFLQTFFCLSIITCLESTRIAIKVCNNVSTAAKWE